MENNPEKQENSSFQEMFNILNVYISGFEAQSYYILYSLSKVTNNTYNMSPKDLGEKVSLSNNDKLEFTKLNPQFIKCIGDNLSLGIRNFKLNYNKIFDDLVNIDNQIPFTQLEYKYKYIKYKMKYLQLKKQFK